MASQEAEARRQAPAARPVTFHLEKEPPEPHQFSLLMWSPNPGVSMTVSFMRTPFSSISAQNHRSLTQVRPKTHTQGGLDPPGGMCTQAA